MSPEALPRVVGFGRYLRRLGLPVGTGRILAFSRAAATLDPFDRGDLYWAGRATLISHPDHIPVFDRAFASYFGPGAAGAETPRPPAVPERRSGTGVRAEDGVRAETSVAAGGWDVAAEDAEAEGETAVRVVASAAEVLRHKSFAELSEEERVQVGALIRRLAMSAPVRRTRRLRPRPGGPRLDMRRTLRRSLRTQGEPFHRMWRDRVSRERPLVVILDVSGSMAPYSRALLQFAFAAMAAGRRVEAFCFGTRLTRVTRSLRTRDPDRALREVSGRVQDWEGGTRIGESLRELLDRWGQRSSLRGAVVVLCSDGLERGDPDLLPAQMARLSRLARRVVWVNPLKGSPEYEPLARGMATALPYVDAFLPGHNLASLEALGEVLAVGA